MANFDFLADEPRYELFSRACLEAEKVLNTSASMCAIGCRKALELAIKWVFSADTSIGQPYTDNLQALVHEPSFRSLVEPSVWRNLQFIIKLGNLSVHTEKQINKNLAIQALGNLFAFIGWVDYSYGTNYQQRTFDEQLIPSGEVRIDNQKIKEQEALLFQRESEIQELLDKVQSLSSVLSLARESNQNTRTLTAPISEKETRKQYIDLDLILMGWVMGDTIIEEYPVYDMSGIPGQTGFVDYVLLGDNGKAVGLVEAKKTSVDPNQGKQQAYLYADCLERKFGIRPIIFYTNGFKTWMWDDTTYPPRQVSSVLAPQDLIAIQTRREMQTDPRSVLIDENISGREYQMEAIKAVCDNIVNNSRKHLLVMATGSGKTRVAASLVDVLSRANQAEHVLFLADRKELVKQAHGAFREHLPTMSLCNLLTNRAEYKARIIFSTYQTILNSIESLLDESGKRVFTPGHFDLIIIDEAHRSIFNKFGEIFRYFDSQLIGLTATPKSEVDRNTYDFFEMEEGVPTYAYDLETAISDEYLVPYKNVQVSTKFLEEGIKYADLSQSDKERYELDFFDDETCTFPEEVPSVALNKFIFNEDTVDLVIQRLMSSGLSVEGGDRIGKTIIFAQNCNHAQFIVERFDAMYPQYAGKWCRRIVYQDSYSSSLISDFKVSDKAPYIAVSVDMLDTGIDVPEVLNLVFFKKVRSKTKFWQMIGRGTRLCEGINCKDGSDEYEDKPFFYIFDYLGNFEYFSTHMDEVTASKVNNLSATIFNKRVSLIQILQTKNDEGSKTLRASLVEITHAQVSSLNNAQLAVRQHREAVERFRDDQAWNTLSSHDVGLLEDEIATLVFQAEHDEYAKRFDNLMYSLMIAFSNSRLSIVNNAVHKIAELCERLERKGNIPQIAEKLELIQVLKHQSNWVDYGLSEYEDIRLHMRNLIQFLSDEENVRRIVTNLKDIEITDDWGGTSTESLSNPYHSENYKKKVNRYIEENLDTVAIHKLRNNQPLTELEYKNLDHIFKGVLGTEDDYRHNFGDTPLGLLIRRIAKLDHAAAMLAFSSFINTQNLNQQQIVFVKKIISYIELNGYIDDISQLKEPPFDYPQSFTTLFDMEQMMELRDQINDIKMNAIRQNG